MMCHCGCQRHKQAAVLQHKYVRLDDLLALHPAWKDVKAIDAQMARLANPVTRYSVQPIDLHEHALPALLSDRMPDIHTVTPDPEQVTRPAQERINDIRERLSERNRRIALRQSEAQQADISADIAAYSASMDAKEAVENEQQTKKQMHEIRTLQLQEIALRSELRILNGMPWGPDVQSKLNTVLARIRDLNDQLPALTAAAHERNRANVAEYRKRKLQELADWASSRRAALDAETDKTITEYRQGIGQSIISLPSLAGTSQWRERRQRRANAPAPRGISPAAPAGAASANTAEVERGMRAQRDRLADYVRSDIERTLARIAERKHWKIVYQPTRGAKDVTGQLAPLLSAEWQAN